MLVSLSESFLFVDLHILMNLFTIDDTKPILLFMSFVHFSSCVITLPDIRILQLAQAVQSPALLCDVVTNQRSDS